MFYVAQGGTTLYKMLTDGTLSTLTLPTAPAVTVSSARRLRAAILGRAVVLANSPTESLSIDPLGRVRTTSIQPPSTPMALSSGGAGALIGAYRVKGTFLVKDEDGRVIAESDFGPESDASAALASEQLQVSGINRSANQFVNGRRLYRTTSGPGDTYFQWIDVDGNTATTVKDNVTDEGLSTLAAPTDLGTPPLRFDLITSWKNRLWGRSAELGDIDTVRFSADGAASAWPLEQFLIIGPQGHDDIGVNGFIARRDELGIGRADRWWKVIGDDPDNFALVVLIEGTGIEAPDSAITIKDVGYWLAKDGVYRWGPEGVKPLSHEKVHAWFNSDDYFNRALFNQAIGWWDPRFDSYNLLLCAAGSTSLDRWVEYQIPKGRWFGPHKTDAFTPTCAALLGDVNVNPMPVLCSSTGYVYKMNQSTASDDGTGIALDIRLRHNCKTPDIEKVFLELSMLTRQESGGTLLITPSLGGLNATSQPAISHGMTLERRRCRRISNKVVSQETGRILTLAFTNSEAAQPVHIYGYELPYHEARAAMTSTLGLRKPYQIQLPRQAEQIDAMFEQLYRRIALLEDLLATAGTGGSGPHELLSDTHTDTTAAAEVNGDLISGRSGSWQRLPVGVNKQVLEVVTGAPAWSNDGSGLEDLNAAELVGTIPTAAYVHSMLSAAHQDSEAASAVLGDMIVAQGGAAIDTGIYWIDGGSFGVLPTTGDPGGGDYWIDGGAWGALVTTGTVLWKRKAVGTTGYVWTASATGPEWQAGGSALGASSAAAAYRSSDFSLADTTLTPVTLQATAFDDGGYWTISAPTRLTVPTGQGGTYVVTGTVTLDSAYVGLAYCYLYVNGVLKVTSPSAGKNAAAPYLDPASVTAILKLNSGDYVELYALIKNNSVGVAFTVKGGATATFLELGRLVSESTVATELPSVVAGSMIKGNSAGNQWERLAIGAANTVLLSDGSAPGWSTAPTLRAVNEDITGVWNFVNGLKERNRPTKIGEWANVAYASGNFTASGALTWTVDAGDQISYKYSVVGKTMYLEFALNLTSTGGVADTELHVAIPGGFLAATTDVLGTIRAYDNGTDTVGFVGCLAGIGYVRCWRSGFATWSAASVNNTTVQCSTAFEVQ